MADSTPSGDTVQLTEADSNAQVAAEAADSEGVKLEVSGEGEKPADPEAKGCCSCGCVCRACIFIITTPILVVLFALAAVIWILLLPLKCLCPCCAPCLQCLFDALFWLIKLPLRFLRWVAGKTEDEEEPIQAEEGKSNYGTTEKKK